MVGSIFSAASSTFFGYLYGRLYCARMEFISASLLPVSPSTSTTSPIMFLLSFVGHCVIFTTALSLLFPPFSLRLGMITSLTKILPSEIRKAKSFSTRSLPTKVSLALLMMLVTIASRIWFLRRAMRVNCTLSPVRANMEFLSATKIGAAPSSGMTVFLPFGLRWKVPSCTCPFMFSWYALSPFLTRKSSHAISSITSTASIFAGCVSSLSALNISLKLCCLSGF